MGRRIVLLLLVSVAVASGGSQAFGQVSSGPRAGAKPEGLKAYVATGDRAEKTLNLVADRGDKPTVFLFVPNALWSRPVARVMKTLDDELARDDKALEGAAVFAVWLAEEPGPLKEHLPRVQTSVSFRKTSLCVYEGSKFGPEAWALNDSVPLTAVVVRNGRVEKSLAIDPADDPDVSGVLKALKGQ